MPSEPSGNARRATVTCSYIKSNFFRVVYGSGAIGGITPSGLINFAIYNERIAIPTTITQELLQDEGRLGGEIARESREGIVRELEVEVLMDTNAANRLVEWLKDKIAVIEELAAGGTEEAKPTP